MKHVCRQVLQRSPSMGLQRMRRPPRHSASQQPKLDRRRVTHSCLAKIKLMWFLCCLGLCERVGQHPSRRRLFKQNRLRLSPRPPRVRIQRATVANILKPAFHPASICGVVAECWRFQSARNQLRTQTTRRSAVAAARRRVRACFRCLPKELSTRPRHLIGFNALFFGNWFLFLINGYHLFYWFVCEF